MKPGTDYIGVTVSFFCHDGKGNLLLHKRSQNCRDERGTWDIGGGKLEFGETIEEGTRREIREEYGCDAEIQRQLPLMNVLRTNHDGKETHWIWIGHIVLVDPNQVVINEPESMDEIGWFRLHELPSPLHSNLEPEIQENYEHLRKYLE